MSTALVSLDAENDLAACGDSAPAPFPSGDKGGRARLRFLHREHPEQTYAAGLLQRGLSVLDIMRGTQRARSGAREIDVNSAQAVRGPKHVVVKGRMPVLNREEARTLPSPSTRARSPACVTTRSLQ